MHTCMYVYLCGCTCVFVYAYVSIYVCMRMCMHDVYVCELVGVHVCKIL